MRACVHACFPVCFFSFFFVAVVHPTPLSLSLSTNIASLCRHTDKGSSRHSSIILPDIHDYIYISSQWECQ